MHTIRSMEESRITSSVEEIVALKVPALRGRDAKTNLMILERLALEGAQTVWNINKRLGRTREQYPTIFRAVTRLKRRMYLSKIGTVKMEKRKGRIPTYGLTWRGFFASLASDKVCTNILDVLDKIDYITLPFPRDIIAPLAKALWDDEQIGKVARSVFQGYVTAIPRDVESIEIPTLVEYFFPAVFQASPILFGAMKQKDPSVLLKYPKLVKWLEEITASQIEKFEKTLERMREARRLLSDLKSKEKI